ncbi:hypothetical protein, partial [Streptomyces sp. NRRL B-24484]|uniref:hypothetical protein n=1 Tax=Streptomyces sp. NRRL B-24484 TaxID=1463833 RepID=UPI001F2C45ED
MASSRFGWESAADGAAEGSRKSPALRFLAGKVGKAGIVAAMSAVAIGIVAPVASASNEANWT